MTLKLLDLEQRSEEWFAWREGQVCTASDAGVIMGDANKSGPQTWEELRSPREPLFVNERMQFGIDNEGEALARLNEVTGIDHVPMLGENTLSNGKAFGASFDGYAKVDGVHHIAEIKIPWEGQNSWLWKQTAQQKVPPPYFWQMVMQFLTVGSKSSVMKFYVYDPNIKDGFLLEYDAEDMLPFANALSKNLLRYSNGEPQFSENELRWIEAAYAKAAAAATRADKERDELKKLLNQALSTVELPYRSQFIRVSEYKRSVFDQTSLLLDYPDINMDKYRKDQKNQRITLAQGAEKRAIEYLGDGAEL